ncbi:hypothetical protein BC834DRAFT_815702 [Gloeopeniophorella convolvens]|nr:hypothetical protein BC834DRAFT_815702 [Gloeopeniophorella convolvens]
MAFSLAAPPRRKGPPSGLRIDTPAQSSSVSLVLGHSSASTSAVSPTTSESGDFQFPPPPRSRPRNMKRLSLDLSAKSSTSSLAIPPQDPQPEQQPTQEARSRRPSIVSTSSLLLRKEEDGSPSAPYPDGPVEIIPKVWLGAEDNVRDWRGLVVRRIGAVLNVAKEVVSPFDSLTSAEPPRAPLTQPLPEDVQLNQGAYYPADATGRPGMHYLKLQWSHGQSDLVQRGFLEAMTFVDRSLARGEGVLIHCQCGISRSATLVIALVMRAASLRSPSVPQEIWDLKGMQAAYAYVKQRSKWVGPNMSLIYQLLEYERVLRGTTSSPTPSEQSHSEAAADEEWIRRRQMLDETSDREDIEQDILEVQREARALDKAMEDRIVARKSSSSSVGSGIGMGPAWRSRYSAHSARKRTGSVASNMTSNSMLSEDLVEEDEEQELLGVGGGFDKTSTRSKPSPLEDHVPSDASSEDDPGASQATPVAPRGYYARVPPSAPASKTSFKLPPVPLTAFKASFDIPQRPQPKTKRRPAPLGILPTVPDSPVNPVATTSVPLPPVPKPRSRKESRATPPAPLHLRRHSMQLPTSQNVPLATPSQTLFVFPPSPTLTARTPSAMTLTSNPVPFPSLATPRLKPDGRRRSLIGLMAPPTPTTAHARVDARGWVGIH